MNTLILGGNGFIGSHLADSLLEKGHVVRIYDRGPEAFREPIAGVEYFIGEFSDTALLAEALSSIDIVYHLISATVPSTSNLDPVYDITSNLINTVKLLELMNKQGVPRIVYLSSGGTVYGIPEYSPIDETHALKPISSYGIVKVAIENYLHMFNHLYGLEYVALRASNPFGPRQGHAGVQGVIGTFTTKVYAGKSLEVWGDGSVIRDYVYIDDLVSLCELAGSSTACGVFNAGSGTGSSVLDVIDVVRSLSSNDVEVKFKDARTFDVPHAVLDIVKASEEFNWEPTVPLDVGISRVWQWLHDQ